MANGALVRTEASDAPAQQGGPSKKPRQVVHRHGRVGQVKTMASGALAPQGRPSGAPARQGGPSINHGKWFTGPAG